MPASLFEPVDETAFLPTEHSRGPWHPELLHGGPVAALLAHQLSAASPSGDWLPARLTVDLVRPVPLSTLHVTTSVVRAGRRAQVLSADCRSGDTLVARAGIQLIATSDVPLPKDSPALRWAELGNAGSPETTETMTPTDAATGTAFHLSAVEHRSSGSPLSGGGPASDWIRVHASLLPGVPLSPFERVVCAADFSNGISSSLPFDDFTFVNADLSVHVFRLPVDEWVQVDATTHLGEAGVGLATARLLDRTGLLGRACQSLVVSTR